MYQAVDKFLPKLRKKIQSEYNYLSTLSFDEINAVTTKNHTMSLYERLLKFNRDEYIKVIKSSREYAISLLNDEEKEKESSKEFDEIDFLEYILSSYNNVTGYLYKKEAQRKRLRLAEEILTAKEFLSRERYETSLRKSANLWYTQSSQYAIDIEDKTALEVFKRAGIKKVMWITSKDENVCTECRKLNKEIFDITRVPSKVHYNCRCYVVPV